MKVGSLVRVVAKNGSGMGDHLVEKGEIGIVTKWFGNRRDKGNEVQIVAAGVGTPHWYFAECWEVISK